MKAGLKDWPKPFSAYCADGRHPLSTAGTDAAAQAAVVRLIQRYREFGHFLARLDPLGDPPPSHPQLELQEVGLDDSQLDKVFHSGSFLGLPQGRLRDI